MTNDSTARPRLKPLFLVKPGTISRPDIRRAERLSGVCIIECADPETARYSEPPIDAEMDIQARAALSLMRMIMAQPGPYHRGDLTRFFVDQLLSAPRPVAATHVAKVRK